MIQLTSLPIVYPEIFLLLMTSVVALVGVNASESRLNLTFWIAQISLAVLALMHLNELQAARTVYGMQRMVVIDPLGHLLALAASLATMITLGFARPYLVARPAQGRVPLAGDVLAAGHLGDGVGQQLPGRLRRPRADEPVAVRADRAAPRPRRVDRSRDEVLHPRRAGLAASCCTACR
jgi:hypothetical protein